MSTQDDPSDENAKRRTDDVDDLQEFEPEEPIELAKSFDQIDAAVEPDLVILPDPADSDFSGLAELSDTSFDPPLDASLDPFLAPDVPLGVPVRGPLDRVPLGNRPLSPVPLPGAFDSFSVDASAGQPANLFLPAGQEPAATDFRPADLHAFLRNDRASIDATPSIVLPRLGADPSGAPPRVFEGAPPLGTPPRPPDFLTGGSSSLGMMRPQVIVSLDKRVELVHAALDAQSDRMEAKCTRIAKREVDYNEYVIYTEQRAVHGDF